MIESVKELIEDIESIVDLNGGDCQEVADRLERAVRKPGFLPELVNEFLRSFVADPAFDDPRWHSNCYMVFTSESIALNIRSHRNCGLVGAPLDPLRCNPIVFTPSATFYVFLGEDIPLVDRYSVLGARIEGDLAAGTQLRFERSERPRRWVPIYSNGIDSLLDFGPDPFVLTGTYLELSLKSWSSRAIIYDRDQLSRGRFVLNDVKITTAIFLLKELRRVRFVRGHELARTLLRHPDYYIRWEAIRYLYTIDRDEGLEALRAARNDDSALVRESAKKSLKYIGA